METKCSVCGATIPNDAPGGHCPRCLLASARFDSAAADRSRPRIPTRDDLARMLPGYSQFELVSEGGMGIVFSAVQDKLTRKVAIKVLPREADRAEDMLAAEARFEREAKALGAMSHPNIVTLYDYGTAEGWHYLVTEFVDGLSLRNWWKSVRLAPTFDVHRVIAPIRQVAEALVYAHARGVVHRDIKPENVLVGTDGRVRVADFGLAKRLGEGASGLRLTETGDRLGTPHYMAPEQVEGRSEIDARCDLFALGVMLYESLTQELPLGSFEPPSRKSRCDARLDMLVARALQRDVDKRISSAAEFVARLWEIELNRAPSVAMSSAPEISEKERTRLRVGLALVGCGLFIAALLPWMSWGSLPGGTMLFAATSLLVNAIPGIVSLPCFLPGAFGALIVATTMMEAAGWIRPRWNWFLLGTILNALLTCAIWWSIEHTDFGEQVDIAPGFGLFVSLLLLVAAYLLLPYQSPSRSRTA